MRILSRNAAPRLFNAVNFSFLWRENTAGRIDSLYFLCLKRDKNAGSPDEGHNEKSCRPLLLALIS
jgi:hypothetical protein